MGNAKHPQAPVRPPTQMFGIIFWGLVTLLVAAVSLREISDPDFWWHLKTGEQMLQTWRLPVQDDFAYTSAFFDTLREQVNLRGYWSWQLLAACFYRGFGFAGISLLNAIVLGGIVASIVWRMRKGEAAPAAIYAVTATVLFLLTWLCLFERPHIISFLFGALLMGLIESVRRGDQPHWLLFPLMILWGNSHAGFIFGDLMLLLFVVSALYLDRAEPKRRRAAIAWGLTGLAVSFLSPNNVKLLRELFRQEGQVFFGEFYEFNNLFWWYANRDKMAAVYLLMIVIGILLALLRRTNGCTLLIAIALAVLAVKHVRLVPMYAVVVLPGVVQELQRGRLDALWSRMILMSAAVGLIVYGIWHETSTRGINFPNTVYEDNALYPVGPASFLKDEVSLQGNMFNDFRSGGYLIWSLYPKHRVFIDTRCLNYPLFAEYRKTADASAGSRLAYKELFAKYAVNFVVKRHQDEFGRIDQILKNLLRDDQWIPIYLDDYWYIAVRRDEHNRAIAARYETEPQAFLQTLYMRYSDKIAVGQNVVKSYLSRADLALFMGDFPAADANIRMALNNSPGNVTATSMRNELAAYRRPR